MDTLPSIRLAPGQGAVIDGRATVRATMELANGEFIHALFQCPGTGDGDHCWNRARALARAAGFTPCEWPY